jgi:hypothetical protein
MRDAWIRGVVAAHGHNATLSLDGLSAGPDNHIKRTAF